MSTNIDKISTESLWLSCVLILTSTVWCCILSAVVMVVVYWAAVGGWRGSRGGENQYLFGLGSQNRSGE